MPTPTQSAAQGALTANLLTRNLRLTFGKRTEAIGLQRPTKVLAGHGDQGDGMNV